MPRLNVNIIGKCMFCSRAVGSDMRPINPVNTEAMDSTDLESVQDGASGSTSQLTSEAPSTFLLDMADSILNLVTEEFERPLDAEPISEENALVILGLLAEEIGNYRYQMFGKSEPKQNPAKRLRKS